KESKSKTVKASLKVSDTLDLEANFLTKMELQTILQTLIVNKIQKLENYNYPFNANLMSKKFAWNLKNLAKVKASLTLKFRKEKDAPLMSFRKLVIEILNNYLSSELIWKE